MGWNARWRTAGARAASLRMWQCAGTSPGDDTHMRSMSTLHLQRRPQAFQRTLNMQGGPSADFLALKVMVVLQGHP